MNHIKLAELSMLDWESTGLQINRILEPEVFRQHSLTEGECRSPAKNS